MGERVALGGRHAPNCLKASYALLAARLHVAGTGERCLVFAGQGEGLIYSPEKSL